MLAIWSGLTPRNPCLHGKLGLNFPFLVSDLTCEVLSVLFGGKFKFFNINNLIHNSNMIFMTQYRSREPEEKYFWNQHKKCSWMMGITALKYENKIYPFFFFLSSHFFQYCKKARCSTSGELLEVFLKSSKSVSPLKMIGRVCPTCWWVQTWWRRTAWQLFLLLYENS